MGFKKKSSHRKAFKKATEYYRDFILFIERQQIDLLEKELASVVDLRIINMVINCTYRGRMQGFVSQSNKALEMLFLAHAKEIIEKTTDVQCLQSLNDTLNEDAKIDPYNVNQLEGIISSRITQMG